MGYMVPAVHGLVGWMWMLTAINTLALAFAMRYSFFHSLYRLVFQMRGWG
jgi:hypothetical protein